MKFLCIALLTLLSPLAAMAQIQSETGYVPFPQDFNKLDKAKQQEVLKSVDENTDKYFHSRAYGAALNQFVAVNNPKDMKSCDKLTMSSDKAKNGITVDDPLLFEKADDDHPLVGKWEQRVSFVGCEKVFEFTILATGNKAMMPNLVLKPE